jgi:hypothetical protein
MQIEYNMPTVHLDLSGNIPDFQLIAVIETMSGLLEPIIKHLFVGLANYSCFVY